MGWNGSGGFTFTYNWVNDKNNGIPITASRMDTQFNDAVTGFQNCITRDAQGVATANIPFPAGLKVDTLNPYTALGPVTLSAGQLKFPASQNASSNANTLDDFSKGTWTPAGSSGNVSGVGYYVKIGPLVHIWASLVIAANIDNEDLTVTGLPYTIGNTAGDNVSGARTVATDSGRDDFWPFPRGTTTIVARDSLNAAIQTLTYSGKFAVVNGFYTTQS